MNTRVVNVKVKYIRPKYNDLKAWCEDDNNIYIGRAGPVFVQVEQKKERYPKQASTWCNPFKVTAKVPLDESLRLYREHLLEMLDDEDTLESFVLLEGKTLGCWCKPERCHGDVISEVLADVLASR